MTMGKTLQVKKEQQNPVQQKTKEGTETINIGDSNSEEGNMKKHTRIEKNQ